MNRSESELIREAITAKVENEIANKTAVDNPVPGRLVGVGVGPGPADLLTIRALRALRRADRVLAPCTSIDSVGRAETIVREAAPDVIVERMVFVMQADTEARAVALAQVCDQVAGYITSGEEVAFITLGDPNIYSTVSSLVAGVLMRAPETKVETVAGIMAFQALASTSQIVLTDDQQSLVLLPASAQPEEIDAEFANAERTVILYKGGGRIKDVADQLETTSRLDGAILGELIGMPGERVAPVIDVRDRPASYLSTVISPAFGGADPTPATNGRKPTRTEPTGLNK